MDQTIQKQLPEWTLEDAYGTVQDKRFQDELQKIYCEIKKLRDLLPTNPTKENVLQCLPIYEDADQLKNLKLPGPFCLKQRGPV